MYHMQFVYFGQLHNAQSQGSVFFSYAQFSVLESVEMIQHFCSKFRNQQSVNNQYVFCSTEEG